MNISSIYGKELSYYAQSASRNNTNNTQLQGLERQLQLLSSQKLQATQSGDSSREEELEEQIASLEEQIQQLKQERVQSADQSGAVEDPADAYVPSESRYFDRMG